MLVLQFIMAVLAMAWTLIALSAIISHAASGVAKAVFGWRQKGRSPISRRPRRPNNPKRNNGQSRRQRRRKVHQLRALSASPRRSRKKEKKIDAAIRAALDLHAELLFQQRLERGRAKAVARRLARFSRRASRVVAPVVKQQAKLPSHWGKGLRQPQPKPQPKLQPQPKLKSREPLFHAARRAQAKVRGPLALLREASWRDPSRHESKRLWEQKMTELRQVREEESSRGLSPRRLAAAERQWLTFQTKITKN